MSHHFDSPTALEDGRLDPTDLYAFAGERPGRTVFVLNVCPDAGGSSPAEFRSECLYEFKLDTDGDTEEDLSLRFLFGEPDGEGRQGVEVRLARAEAARDGVEGEALGSGSTEEEIQLLGGGRAWAGRAGDPFFANGLGLGAYLAAISEGRFDPGEFAGVAGNTFEGRDVMSVVAEVPDALLGTGRLGVWGELSLYGHAPQRQVNRIGRPLVNPFFFQGEPEPAEAFGKAHPRDDLRDHGERVARRVGEISRAAGRTGDPDAYGRRLAEEVFLPDVLGYEPGTPACYGFGSRNGRALVDDVMDVVISLTANAPVSDGPRAGLAPRAGFPYVPEALRRRHDRDLADVFGLKG